MKRKRKIGPEGKKSEGESLKRQTNLNIKASILGF
jgi:hypothetical protein